MSVFLLLPFVLVRRFVCAVIFWTQKVGPKKPLLVVLVLVVGISSPGSKNPQRLS